MGNAMTTGLLMTCVMCYVCQGLFGKLYAIHFDGQANDATPVYSTLYGLVVGLGVLAVALGFRLEASSITWTLGLINGAVLFVYNLCIINASRTGPFGFQSIFRLFGSVVIPMVFALVFWGESLSVLRWLGIAVMLASFVLVNADGMVLRDVKKGYVGWVTLLFFVNGAYAVIMAAQQRLAGPTERNQMIVITFLSSACISLASLLLRRKADTLRAFRMGRKAWGSALGAGIAAALAVVQLMILIGRVESLPVFYTVENGLILVLTIVFSSILFKEKISRTAAIGIALSVVSLAMLSL